MGNAPLLFEKLKYHRQPHHLIPETEASHLVPRTSYLVLPNLLLNAHNFLYISDT